MSTEHRGPFDHLLPHVHSLLAQCESGTTEFELLRRLQDSGVEPFASAQLEDPLSLFRTHFILFHCLYRLQDSLRSDGSDLDIHCLRIALVPCNQPRDAGPHPDTFDPLRGYYLDLARLRETREDDVVAMLTGGSSRLGELGRRREALMVLGLKDPVAFSEVKRRYRRLVMQHHPDRGGDKLRLQEINEAFDLLRSP